MRAFQPLLCSLRGGHQWETTEDPSGDLTACSRCGKLRHARGGADPPGIGSMERAAERSANFAAKKEK